MASASFHLLVALLLSYVFLVHCRPEDKDDSGSDNPPKNDDKQPSDQEKTDDKQSEDQNKSNNNQSDDDETPDEDERKICSDNAKDKDIISVSTLKDQPCKVMCEFEDGQVTYNSPKDLKCSKNDTEGICSDNGICLINQ